MTDTVPTGSMFIDDEANLGWIGALEDAHPEDTEAKPEPPRKVKPTPEPVTASTRRIQILDPAKVAHLQDRLAYLAEILAEMHLESVLDVPLDGEAVTAAIPRRRARAAAEHLARSAEHGFDLPDMGGVDPLGHLRGGDGKFSKSLYSVGHAEAEVIAADKQLRNAVQASSTGRWLVSKDGYLSRLGIARGQSVLVRYGDPTVALIDVRMPDGTIREKRVPWSRFSNDLAAVGEHIDMPEQRGNRTREPSIDIANRIKDAGGEGNLRAVDAYLARRGINKDNDVRVRWLSDTQAQPLNADGTPNGGPVSWARFHDPSTPDVEPTVQPETAPPDLRAVPSIDHPLVPSDAPPPDLTLVPPYSPPGDPLADVLAASGSIDLTGLSETARAEKLRALPTGRSYSGSDADGFFAASRLGDGSFAVFRAGQLDQVLTEANAAGRWDTSLTPGSTTSFEYLPDDFDLREAPRIAELDAAPEGTRIGWEAVVATKRADGMWDVVDDGMAAHETYSIADLDGGYSHTWAKLAALPTDGLDAGGLDRHPHGTPVDLSTIVPADDALWVAAGARDQNALRGWLDTNQPRGTRGDNAAVVDAILGARTPENSADWQWASREIGQWSAIRKFGGVDTSVENLRRLDGKPGGRLSTAERREIAEAFFQHDDLPDGWTSLVDTVDNQGDGTFEVNGSMWDSDGDKAGEFSRMVDLDNRTVTHEVFRLFDGYTGFGQGAAMTAKQFDAYEHSGLIDTVETHPTSDATPMWNGGYTWARLGFGWADDNQSLIVSLHFQANTGMMNAAERAEFEALEARRRSSVVGAPAYPTPNDYALIGYANDGRDNWAGKEIMGNTSLSYEAVRKVRPTELTRPIATFEPIDAARLSAGDLIDPRASTFETFMAIPSGSTLERVDSTGTYLAMKADDGQWDVFAVTALDPAGTDRRYTSARMHAESSPNDPWKVTRIGPRVEEPAPAPTPDVPTPDSAAPEALAVGDRISLTDGPTEIALLDGLPEGSRISDEDGWAAERSPSGWVIDGGSGSSWRANEILGPDSGAASALTVDRVGPAEASAVEPAGLNVGDSYVRGTPEETTAALDSLPIGSALKITDEDGRDVKRYFRTADGWTTNSAASPGVIPSDRVAAAGINAVGNDGWHATIDSVGNGTERLTADSTTLDEIRALPVGTVLRHNNDGSPWTATKRADGRWDTTSGAPDPISASDVLAYAGYLDGWDVLERPDAPPAPEVTPAADLVAGEPWPVGEVIAPPADQPARRTFLESAPVGTRISDGGTMQRIRMPGGRWQTTNSVGDFIGTMSDAAFSRFPARDIHVETPVDPNAPIDLPNLTKEERLAALRDSPLGIMYTGTDTEGDFTAVRLTGDQWVVHRDGELVDNSVFSSKEVADGWDEKLTPTGQTARFDALPVMNFDVTDGTNLASLDMAPENTHIRSRDGNYAASRWSGGMWDVVDDNGKPVQNSRTDDYEFTTADLHTQLRDSWHAIDESDVPREDDPEEDPDYGYVGSGSSSDIDRSPGASSVVDISNIVPAAPDMWTAAREHDQKALRKWLDDHQPKGTRGDNPIVISAILGDPPENEDGYTVPTDEWLWAAREIAQWSAVRKFGSADDASHLRRFAGSTSLTEADRREIAAGFFEHDLGGGVHSKVVGVSSGSSQFTVEGQVLNSRGSTIGTFTRSVSVDSGRVYHSVFQMSGSSSGRGIGAAMTAKQFDAYEQSGLISVVDVSPHSDSGDWNGGYTWARLGFDWGDETDASDVAAQFHNYSGLMNGDEQDEFDSLEGRRSETPFKIVGPDGHTMVRNPAYPTPNDYALIGWANDGRDNWAGKEIMGNTELDYSATRPVVPVEVRRVDPEAGVLFGPDGAPDPHIPAKRAEKLAASIAEGGSFTPGASHSETKQKLDELPVGTVLTLTRHDGSTSEYTLVEAPDSTRSYGMWANDRGRVDSTSIANYTQAAARADITHPDAPSAPDTPTSGIPDAAGAVTFDAHRASGHAALDATPTGTVIEGSGFTATHEPDGLWDIRDADGRLKDALPSHDIHTFSGDWTTRFTAPTPDATSAPAPDEPSTPEARAEAAILDGVLWDGTLITPEIRAELDDSIHASGSGTARINLSAVPDPIVALEAVPEGSVYNDDAGRVWTRGPIYTGGPLGWDVTPAAGDSSPGWAMTSEDLVRSLSYDHISLPALTPSSASTPTAASAIPDEALPVPASEASGPAFYDSLPVGAKLYNGTGRRVYTKEADGGWTDLDGVPWTSSELPVTGHTYTMPSGTSEATTTIPRGAEGVTTLDAFPTGTTVRATDHTATRQPDGLWNVYDSDGKLFDSVDSAGLFEFPGDWTHSAATTDTPASVPLTRDFRAGGTHTPETGDTLTWENADRGTLDALPEGTQIRVRGNTMTRRSGEWEWADGGISSSELVANMMGIDMSERARLSGDPAVILRYGEPTAPAITSPDLPTITTLPIPDTPDPAAWFDSLPIGSKVYPPGGSSYWYTKGIDGKWVDVDGSKWSSRDMPVTGHTYTMPVDISEYQAGQTLSDLNEATVSSFPAGTVVKLNRVAYTKTNRDTWQNDAGDVMESRGIAIHSGFASANVILQSLPEAAPAAQPGIGEVGAKIEPIHESLSATRERLDALPAGTTITSKQGRRFTRTATGWETPGPAISEYGDEGLSPPVAVSASDIANSQIDSGPWTVVERADKPAEFPALQPQPAPPTWFEPRTGTPDYGAYSEGPGVVSEPTLAAINQGVGPDGRVQIRIRSRYLGSLGEHGRFLSQFETGHSTGSYSPDTRANMEATLFSTPRDIPASERPIYGALWHPDHGRLLGDRADSYGDVVVVLRADSAHRTTFTIGDSLQPSSRFNPMVLADARRQLAADGTIDRGQLSEAIVRPEGGTEGYFSYTEAQIHGGVALDRDVSHIEISAADARAHGEELARIRDQYNIPIVVLGSEGSRTPLRTSGPALTRDGMEALPVGAKITDGIETLVAAGDRRFDRVSEFTAGDSVIGRSATLTTAQLRDLPFGSEITGFDADGVETTFRLRSSGLWYSDGDGYTGSEIGRMFNSENAGSRLVLTKLTQRSPEDMQSAYDLSFSRPTWSLVPAPVSVLDNPVAGARFQVDDVATAQSYLDKMPNGSRIRRDIVNGEEFFKGSDGKWRLRSGGSGSPPIDWGDLVGPFEQTALPGGPVGDAGAVGEGAAAGAGAAAP